MPTPPNHGVDEKQFSDFIKALVHDLDRADGVQDDRICADTAIVRLKELATQVRDNERTADGEIHIEQQPSPTHTIARQCYDLYDANHAPPSGALLSPDTALERVAMVKNETQGFFHLLANFYAQTAKTAHKFEYTCLSDEEIDNLFARNQNGSDFGGVIAGVLWGK